MTTKYLPVVIMFSILLFSCSAEKELPAKKMLIEKFGMSYFSWNADSTFLLMIKETGGTDDHFFVPLIFSVYSFNCDSIIYRSTYPGGSVKWIDNYILKIEIQPGNITGDETENDFRFFYDVKANKITTTSTGD